jgi:hypothetical protein
MHNGLRVMVPFYTIDSIYDLRSVQLSFNLHNTLLLLRLILGPPCFVSFAKRKVFDAVHSS